MAGVSEEVGWWGCLGRFACAEAWGGPVDRREVRWKMRVNEHEGVSQQRHVWHAQATAHSSSVSVQISCSILTPCACSHTGGISNPAHAATGGILK